jgi:hypothetical protein
MSALSNWIVTPAGRETTRPPSASAWLDSAALATLDQSNPIAPAVTARIISDPLGKNGII